MRHAANTKNPPDATTMRVAMRHSSLGRVLVAQTAHGISAILLGDDPAVLRLDLQNRFPSATLQESDAALDLLATQVVQMIESPARELDAPLDMHGTGFQRDVWCALRDIPAGSTATYTDIANRIGRPKSARAVAQACAANPLAVVVPCHRVLRRDGQLSGYRWGVERKRELLAREATPP